jgi:hypothetical protein
MPCHQYDEFSSQLESRLKEVSGLAKQSKQKTQKLIIYLHVAMHAHIDNCEVCKDTGIRVSA